MNVTEIRQKEGAELSREIAATEKEIWKLRFSRGTEKAGDPSKIRHLRKDVARMMTVLRERELGFERGAKQ